jgi:hypothetical protein
MQSSQVGPRGPLQHATPRRVAIAFVALLALLVAHNVYWLVRNQRGLSCKEKVCVSPLSLERYARLSANPKIFALANYYFLNRHIPHARLAVPPWMAPLEWNLEHLSQLRVEVGDGPLLIDPRHAERLAETSTKRRLWDRRRRGQPESGRMLYLRVAPGSTDYVVAETGKAGDPIFILPTSEYAAVARSELR